MTGSLDIPLVFSGDGFEAKWFTTHAVLELRPPSTQGGFSIREWPLGDLGGLFVGIESSDVAHVDVSMAGADESSDADPPRDGVERARSLTVRLPAGAQVVARRGAARDDDRQWQRIDVLGVEPRRWVRVGDADLVLAVDDDDRLAVIAFDAAIPQPARRLVTLTSERGWTAQANPAFAQHRHPGDEPAGYGVSISRREPEFDADPTTWAAQEVDESCALDAGWEDETAVDGSCHVALQDGALHLVDGLAVEGEVDAPEAGEARDAIEVELSWPPAPTAITIDTSSSPALARVDLGGEAARWIELQPDLLVGIDGGGALAALVATNVEVVSLDAFAPFGPHPSQAEMMQHALASMREHHDLERERSDRYATERPFPAFGPVSPPPVATVSMRMVDSPFGQSSPPIGVQLTWGEEFAAMTDPGADRTAPLLAVVHARAAMLPVPTGADAIEFDDDLGWLHAQEMVSRQWAAMDDPSQAAELEHTMAMAGPESHRRGVERVAATARAATLVIDGAAFDATRYDTDDAFVVRADIGDGWRVSVRASRIAGIPELVAVDDLAPFVSGQRAEQDRMVAVHERSAQLAQAEEPAPQAARRIRDAVERIAVWLRGQHFPVPGAPTRPDPVELFAPAIVESWGGPDALRSRFDVTTRLVDIQAHFGSCDPDGTVASAGAHVSLPRPDGGGFGVSVGILSPWWEQDADAIRSHGSHQPPRDVQGEYHLQFNLLVERQDDGSYVLATDVLRLIDEHVGGIERLLAPVRT